jgi:uncharacterized membrane protein
MGGGLVTAAAAIAMTEFGLMPTLIFVLVVFIFWVCLGLKLGQKPKITKNRNRREKRLGKFVTKE